MYASMIVNRVRIGYTAIRGKLSPVRRHFSEYVPTIFNDYGLQPPDCMSFAFKISQRAGFAIQNREIT